MKHIMAILATFGIISTSGASENMKIQINGTDYTVELDDNVTVDDIVATLPLSLKLVRFAGHEYYDTLPFTPRSDAPKTSKLLAGHVYYWDGGNSFVINFADYDIAPYRNVHIGRIVDAQISDILKNASGDISVMVMK